MQDSWLELGDEAPVSKATNFKRAWRCKMLEEVLVVEECWNMRILTSEAKFATRHCNARQVGRGDETCVESPKFQMWKLSIGKSHKLRG